VALSSPDISRERLGIYGQEGSGKSKAYWSIAKKMRQTQAPGKMYVADLDASWERMSIGYPGWEENMVIGEPYAWTELIGTVERYSKLATRDCWLAIDNLGEGWTSAKGHVIEAAHGKNLSDWLTDELSGRKKDYGKTPDAQNKTWRELSNLIVHWPGHVICTCPAKSVFKDDNAPSNAMANRYLQIGWQPDTQKTVGYLFHTVLYLADLGDLRSEMWAMTTVKDRERKKVVNGKVSDFCMDYLVGVGGWTL